MEKELIISVIMPIYNGENVVRRSVDSVLCQMDGRIELILVDDGSTDTSGAICDEYAAQCSHIHVIHKKNGGTSSAKNMGIERAKGRYLSFMDCDDFFDANTFAQIIPVLQEHEPDCLDFGWRYVDARGGISENLHQCKKNTLLPLQELETVILPPLLNLREDDAHFVFDFCWNKIFKAEIIKKYQTRFDEEKRTWEDRTFLLRHLRYCQNYYAMDKCFYNYAYTPNSLSQRYSLDFLRIVLANFSHYRQMYEDRFDFDTPYANDYRVRSVENIIYRSLEQQENREIIRSNILEALQNAQVIQWFTRWKPNDSVEHTIRRAIVSGDCEKALKLYAKKAAQKRRKQALRDIIGRIKQCVKKVLGR